MHTRNFSPQKESPSTHSTFFDTLSARLAFFTSLYSLLTLLFVIVAYVLRMNSNHSLGVMLPISIGFVSAGILLSGIEWLFSWRMYTHPEVAQRCQKRIAHPRMVSTCTISLLEILLALLVVILFFNKRLFGLAYIGITPTLFLLFSLSITYLVLLLKKNNSFSIFARKLRTLSAQEIMLFVLSVIGLLLAGLWFSEKLFPQIQGYLGSYSESKLLHRLFLSACSVLFANLSFFIISFIPWKENLFLHIFGNDAVSQNLERSFFQKHKFISSLLIASLFMIGFTVFCQSSYDTNDDILMVQILSGYFGGEPVQFPVYSNVILGFLYQALFNLRREFNWVSCFYIVINWLSIWSLIHSVLNLNQKRFYKFFCIAIILLFDSYFLTNLTYTTIAATASMAGMCAILESAHIRFPEQRYRQISGGALILVGSLIRLESTGVALILFIPFLLVNFRHFFSKSTLIPLISTAILVLGCCFFDKQYLHAYPKWESFYRYNQLHQQLRDTPRVYNFGDEPYTVKSVSWSSNDTDLFYEWLTLDKTVYSEYRMEFLVNQISNWWNDTNRALKLGFTNITAHPPYDFLLLAISAWLIVLLSTKNRRVIYSSLLLFILLISLELILSLGYKIPYRVIIPLLMTFTVITLFSPDWMRESPKQAKIEKERVALVFKSAMLFVVITAVLAWAVFLRPFSFKKINLSKQETYAQVVTDLNNLSDQGVFTKDTLLLSSGAGLPFEFMDPFHLKFPEVEILSMGWNSFSPVYEYVLEQHNITEITRALVDKEVYLITSADLIPKVEKFYQEHYSLDVQAVPVYVMGQTEVTITDANQTIIYNLQIQ